MIQAPMKIHIKKYKALISFFFGVSVVIGSSFIYNPFSQDKTVWYEVGEKKDEVHVHADFAMYINDERIDLTDDKYQSKIDHILLTDFHLHDNNDKVLHRHAEGITLGNFLESLGFVFTNECITTDTGVTYCSDNQNSLSLYVNGTIMENAPSYVVQEEDQILLYFGKNENPALPVFMSEVTADSCIYSGTCPEKGTPPPESCGLTCEI